MHDCVMCRYIVAETQDTVYVSFVGTKRLQDLLTDLNYWQTHLQPEDALSRPSADGGRLLVHQGFMARAQGIPIEQLYQLAEQKNKSLCFCGVILSKPHHCLSCCLVTLHMCIKAAMSRQLSAFACGYV